MKPEQLLALKEDRAKDVESARALLDKAAREKRSLTSTEQSEYDKLWAGIQSKKAQIAAEETIQSEERELALPEKRQSSPADPYRAKRRAAGNGGGDTETPRTEWRDSSGNAVAVLNPSDSLYEYRSRAEGFWRDDRDLHIGKAIRGIITGDWRDAEAEQRAMAGGSGASGGFLLNPVLSSRVIDLARSASSVIQAGAVTVPWENGDELVMARVTADPSAQWRGENQTITDAEPTLGRVTFKAKKLVINVPVARELVSDAPNAPDAIVAVMRSKAGNEIDRVALLGSGGDNEPTGLFNSITDGVVDQGSVGSLDYADLLDAIKSAEGNNGAPSAYILTPTQKNTLAKLLVNSEANHYAVAPEDVANLRRFVTTQLADSQLALGDFSQMMIGVRSQVTVEVAPAVFSNKDQSVIRLVWRGDVQFAHANHLVALTGIS